MLRFALKYEPIDLGVLVPAMRALGDDVVRAWVLDEPTSAFARRAWFLYERYVGERIDLPDAVRTVQAPPALNGALQFALPDRDSALSSRHRVRDNLLGSTDFCPLVRRTAGTERVVGADLREEILAAAKTVGSKVFLRAVRWLQAEETRSSFEIEGDTNPGSRAERFMVALERRMEFTLPPDEGALVRLQRSFVDVRYANDGWRRGQVFVGGGAFLAEERITYMCPKPEDIPRLMGGWREMTARVVGSADLDPVIAAAIVAFGFVFIHPFDDGNGRIHRFLLHKVFEQRDLSGPLLLPVSAVILKRLTDYHRALESVTQPMMSFIHWERHFEEGRSFPKVLGDTVDFYRFLDMTPIVEFTAEVLVETVRVELPRELQWIDRYDRSLRGVLDRIDLPNREASLFVRLCMQHGGTLSAKKRKLFDKLTDDEINDLEAIVQRAMNPIDDDD